VTQSVYNGRNTADKMRACLATKLAMTSGQCQHGYTWQCPNATDLVEYLVKVRIGTLARKTGRGSFARSRRCCRGSWTDAAAKTGGSREAQAARLHHCAVHQPGPDREHPQGYLAGDALRNDDIVTPLLPHLCLAWHLVYPAPPEVWYDYTVELEAHCHAAIREDSRHSTGGDREVELARTTFKIPVFYEVADLYKWVVDVWRETA